MYNQYINPIFKEIMGRDFTYDSKEDNSIMHCIVFLCLMYGAPIGHYAFINTNKGPRSGSLSDDLAYMYEKDKTGYTVYDYVFSSDVLKVINKIKGIVSVVNGINLGNYVTDWIECVATLKYWKEFVYSTEDSQELLQIMRCADMYVNILYDEKAYIELYRIISEEF